VKDEERRQFFAEMIYVVRLPNGTYELWNKAGDLEDLPSGTLVAGYCFMQEQVIYEEP
jgi:hypothetical protein